MKIIKDIAHIGLLGVLLLFAMNWRAADTGEQGPYAFRRIVFGVPQPVEREAPPRKEARQNARPLAAVADNAAPAVVLISAYKDAPMYSIRHPGRGWRAMRGAEEVGISRQRVSTGTGFFISSDGYLITNNHVVAENGAEYTVDTGVSEIPARIVYRDEDFDLAVLKVEGNNYPVIRLADSSRITAGERVIGIGNSMGKMDSVSSGRISALNQDIQIHGENDEIEERLHGLIQTSLALHPGDSGGPLLNSDGNAVGVNVATAVGAPLSYAIPATSAQTVAQRAGIRI